MTPLSTTQPENTMVMFSKDTPPDDGKVRDEFVQSIHDKAAIIERAKSRIIVLSRHPPSVAVPLIDEEVGLIEDTYRELYDMLESVDVGLFWDMALPGIDHKGELGEYPDLEWFLGWWRRCLCYG